MMAKVWAWLGKAFSDEHGPSSSRIISAWLSVSSMSLIWWISHHMMQQPVDKLAVWMGNLPMLVGSLATFSTAPYGIGKLAGMFKKAGDKVAEHEEHKDDK
jgi:peptidoglycan biosynthesis protein MviN/MurJ (putative lipid II flippase)